MDSVTTPFELEEGFFEITFFILLLDANFLTIVGYVYVTSYTGNPHSYALLGDFPWLAVSFCHDNPNIFFFSSACLSHSTVFSMLRNIIFQ